MHNFLFYLILIIVLANYFLDRWLELLNARRWSAELPGELRDVYDQAEYKRSQQYKRDNDKFAWITSTFSLMLIVLMLLFNGFALVDSWSRDVTGNPVLIAIVFFAILALASDLLNTPFGIYETFVIEERYGFNKTTPRIFLTDKLKGWLLGALLGGPLLALVVWFYQLTHSGFWIYAWALLTFFLLFMTLFYSNLIVPLFNKQTPLEEGELRSAIETMAQKAGFKLKNIYVIDNSKRSTKSNAYFTGLGPKKRIVLFDTLIKELDTAEIVAVLAHEIGHYRLKHTLTGLILSVLESGISLFILSLLIDNPALSAAMGSTQPSFHMGLIAFGILYAPISFFLGIGLNILSRKNEYAADRFAAQQGQSENLIRALKKLSARNLSNLTPHPIYVFFHYSHPTLLQRIQELRKMNINS